MNESHECDMYHYCWSTSKNREKYYCIITGCHYMILKRQYDELIKQQKDIKEFIKECESEE